MSKTIEGDPTTSSYWNQRVKAVPDPKDMLFMDGRREEYWRRVRAQLELWADLKVLDVACGYGQFAKIFRPEKYQGVDFSEEMIKLFKIGELSYYQATVVDAKEYEPTDKYEVIFEVNSLRSLNMKPEHFFEKFKGHATKIVACLEADSFIIYNLYEKT